MTAMKHVHKYYKKPFGNYFVWGCALSNEGCTHYIPRHQEDDILNRRSICWHCGRKFILDYDSIQNDKPVCDHCKGNDKIIDYLERKHVLDPIFGINSPEKIKKELEKEKLIQEKETEHKRLIDEIEDYIPEKK